MVDLRDLVKRYPLLHRTYRFVRVAPSIPVKRWLQIKQLRALFDVLPATMVPVARLFDTYDAVVQVNAQGLQGDIVECGVWNGGCVGLMAIANSHHPGPARHFHLFDSFEGLPQPTLEDADGDVVVSGFRSAENHEITPMGSLVGSAQPAVEAFLRDLGVAPEELTFHPGWFQETVPGISSTIGPLSVLRLDGDLYDSTRVCLEGLYDKVMAGGYVIIDDYGSFPGCRRAVDEFFEKRGVRPEFHYSDSEGVWFRKPS